MNRSNASWGILLLFSTIFILLNFTATASDKFTISISPIMEQSYGSTDYELDLQFFDYDSDSIIVLRRIISLLEFPLDITQGGFNLSINSAITQDKFWFAELQFLSGLTNPTKLMKDHDWDKAVGRFDTKFSYTESKPKNSSITIILEAGKEIFSIGKIRNGILLGLRYQKINQDIDNFDGWQKRFDPIAYNWVDSSDFENDTLALALTYEVSYLRPEFGIISLVDLSNSIRLSLKSAYTPVFAKDEDDHILRKKLSISKGNGNGFISNFKIEFLPKTSPKKTVPFISFYSEYSYLNVKTNQTQTWYGDDPASPGIDDTGTEISGVPHEIESTQIKIGLQLGFRFQ